MRNKILSIFAMCVGFILIAAPGSCQNGPSTNQTFHYGVTAVTANGESAYSNDVSVVVPNDGATHTVTLNFTQSTSTALTKNCWYRSTASASAYVLPGTCSTVPVTTFIDNTLAAVAPPKPPTMLPPAIAEINSSDKPILAKFKSKDGKLIATLR